MKKPDPITPDMGKVIAVNTGWYAKYVKLIRNYVISEIERTQLHKELVLLSLVGSELMAPSLVAAVLRTKDEHSLYIHLCLGTMKWCTPTGDIEFDTLEQAIAYRLMEGT